MESKFELRSMFHWNREASVEGSHIFLLANELTHTSQQEWKLPSVLFRQEFLCRCSEVIFCYLNINNNNNVNTLCNASTDQGRNRAKENTTKSRQELRVNHLSNYWPWVPVRTKISKVCCFLRKKKSSLKRNRTDLSLVCNLNNEKFVFGLDLRNSAPHITQLSLNVEYDNLCWQ